MGAHSTRAAATLHAKSCGVSFKQIAKTANWSFEKTFAKHYKKPIEMTLAEAIMKKLILNRLTMMNMAVMKKVTSSMITTRRMILIMAIPFGLSIERNGT